MFEIYFVINENLSCKDCPLITKQSIELWIDHDHVFTSLNTETDYSNNN